MRLIVAASRDHQRNLARKHPEDKVVCVGDALYGYRVSEIVDETDQLWKLAGENDWWIHAECRVTPR